VDFLGKWRTLQGMRQFHLSALLILAAAQLLPAPAPAQSTATLWWEVNAGDGWQSGDITTSRTSVIVRRMATWQGGINTIFGASFFDATVAGPSGASDTASDFFQAHWLTWPGYSPFAARRFGNTLKVDVASDTAAPGLGNLWIFPYQEADNADPHRDNPIELFRYTLSFDAGIFGVRTVSEVHGLLPFQGANISDRVIALYTNQVRVIPAVTRLDARINYIPAPAHAAFLIIAAGSFRRRR